jgi:6-methylsalicylate decarboxylase
MTSAFPSKVDVHHHFLPPPYIQALSDNGGDPSGWATPAWSPEGSVSLMKDTGASHAILSVTAPGAMIIADPKPQATLARQCNDYASQLHQSDPKHFSFFASLPNLTDATAAIEEIEYALNLPGCMGITCYTCYSGRYLGDSLFEPIWAELNKKTATVFVHPNAGPHVDLCHPTLPLPFVDYPQETTRATMSLIVSGFKRKFADVKFILSHAGGTLPYLANRVNTMYSMVFKESGFTREGMEADAKSFYFDTALSTDHKVLDLLLSWAGPERILFGSDFPYAPRASSVLFAKDLDAYKIAEQDRERIYQKNALGLFHGLQVSE